MNEIERIRDSNFALMRFNYRKKDVAEYRQELNNARYEGYMRSDFTAPKVSEYTHDEVKVVRLGVEE